ncbi:MAG: PqqD family protein [Candidatus Caldarchaeum sp.]|nr:PqqD family protein [Candidatus Caldarchaeum sp.]MCS7133792.1 PqqD family protein [Candidatus Caldarchaeum sp.]MCX8200718.1 PqqD family protein [Candidatus Caldarchaeum sp.]MDW8063231.1 PqqD family protein [Candidatus Caldarchaeum sp.]MDW8434959.1 PqqD family protein [Candidatus Caldarchaeum sp.]
MVEEKRLSKKGWLSQTQEGDLLLVNENGEAYKVNEAVVAIWNMFEDKTVTDVVEEVALQIHRDPAELKDPIEQLASKLVEAGLIG